MCHGRPAPSWDVNSRACECALCWTGKELHWWKVRRDLALNNVMTEYCRLSSNLFRIVLQKKLLRDRKTVYNSLYISQNEDGLCLIKLSNGRICWPLKTINSWLLNYMKQESWFISSKFYCHHQIDQTEKWCVSTYFGFCFKQIQYWPIFLIKQCQIHDPSTKRNQ